MLESKKCFCVIYESGYFFARDSFKSVFALFIGIRAIGLLIDFSSIFKEILVFELQYILFCRMAVYSKDRNHQPYHFFQFYKWTFSGTLDLSVVDNPNVPIFDIIISLVVLGLAVLK